LRGLRLSRIVSLIIQTLKWRCWRGRKKQFDFWINCALI